MDDPRVLRIITVGLVLAALAVVYFLLTGGIGVRSKKVQTQSNTERAVLSTTPSPVSLVITSPSPVVNQRPAPTATPSATQRTQNNVQTLPNTGFPIGLAIVFSASAIISGWSLRKYPN